MIALTAVLPAIAFILKEGATSASFLWIGAVVTVLSLGTFLLWMAYAFLARSSTMDKAAQLPFDLDDDGGVQ